MSLEAKEAVGFKVLLIGPQGVGKSSLIQKYVNNKFTYDYSITVGIEYYTKQIQINDRTTVKVHLWDTMGQEIYKAIVKSHYKGVAAVLLLYAIDRKESYKKLGMWLQEIRDNTHEETIIFLVGSKLDLEDLRTVSREEGEAYCKVIEAVGFIEVSAKTGENIKELFDRLAKTLFKKFQSNKAFKELVKPTSYSKSQSFSLKKFGALYNHTPNQRKCC